MRTDQPGSGGVDETGIFEEIRLDPDWKVSGGMVLDPIEARRIVESMGAGSRALDALNFESDVAIARAARFTRLRRVQRFLLGLTGFGFGWVGRLIEAATTAGSGASLLPTVLPPLVGLALILVGYNRFRGDRKAFQVDNAIIWSSFAVGWSVLMPGARGEWLPGCICWGALAALGLLIVRRRDTSTS